MKSQLFREKSMKRVSSPEQLNDYIRVTNPSVWIAFASVIILLLGICVWGVFGKLDTLLTVGAVTEGERTVCYVKESDIKNVSADMKVRVNGEDYAIAEIAGRPVQVDAAFNEVIPSGSMRLFWAVIVFSLCLSISSMLFGILKSLLDDKVGTQMSISIQSAAMARVLSLPAEFFKKYSAGELTTKLQYFNSLCSTLYSNFIVMGLSSVFSLIYITQVFNYAPALVVPSLCITAATLGFSVFNTFIRMKISKQSMEAVGKKNGLTYALISGIQKIKLSGAERRAFTRWTKVYSEEVKTTYGVPLTVPLSGTIGMLISMTGTIVMYYFAIRYKVTVADYYAFTAAYGMVSGAFSSLVNIGLQAARIRPTLEQIKPIMETVPEISEDKNVLTRVSGGIELNNVSFRYPKVLRYIMNHSYVRMDAEDIVQTVFMKVFEKWDTFDQEKSSISTWIYNITRNTLIDHQRAMSYRRHDELSESLTDDSDDVLERLVLEDEQERLAAALENLSSENRDLIILHYYSQHTLLHIAEMMQRPYGQIKRLRVKALEKLRRQLDK